MSKVKLLPLQGLKSVHALCAFNALLFGLHCTPAHAAKSEEEFYGWFDNLSDEDKQKNIRYSVALCKLSEEEMLDLLAFCADANGIPFGRENLSAATPDYIVECIVAVCMAIANIKLKTVGENLKKNSSPTV